MNRSSSEGESAGSLIYSVGTRLFIIIFISIVVCVLMVGMLAYSEAKGLVERKVSESSMQTIKQVASNMDVIFKTYEDITLSMFTDKEFQKLTENIMNQTNDYERFTTENQLSSKLQSFMMTDSSIRGMMLIPLHEKLPVLIAGNSTVLKVDEIKAAEWYNQILEYSGKTFWIPTQLEGLTTQQKSPSIGLGRVLRNTGSNNSTFVVIIDLSVESVSKRFSDVYLGENSELIVMDEQNNYIISNNEELINQPAPVTLPTDGDEAEYGSKKLLTASDEEVLTVYQKFKAMDWKLTGIIPVEELVKDAQIINRVTWITIAVAALIAITVGIFVVFTIARPLNKLTSQMAKGAKGNLTVRYEEKKRRDEIGQLGGSFNEMMTQIAGLAKQTTQSAVEVLATAEQLSDVSKKTALAAQEIAVATEEIAKGATSLAHEAERGSDLTVNITDQMKAVIYANEQMVQSAAEVEQASEKGTSYMSTLIEKTGQTEEMTRSMVEKVETLKDSTGSIVEILELLNNITKQTNILSLNATIEAARAGSAGKGFMVVADEIRKLADQSRHSIDVVGQMIAKIETEMDETVEVLVTAHPLFQEQIASVKEANQIFLAVRGQMSEFAQSLDVVSSSVIDLNQSQAIVAEAMTNVSAVAEESSATSEEVASLSSEQMNISTGLVQLSEQLDSVSQGLKETLSKFKIQ
ncbi:MULTISPECIES: methyl-accepting chemotaxis protein [unclassified Paenibacillus]|uniref:methyl-accepting chemotaxis protein n=1 Tax=unclassified Paenibacillus TaxID=185978 RepID=UPI002F3F799B